MSSSYGQRIRVTLFGQSHGEAIGMVLDGLPAGETIDMAALQKFLDRRAPGQSNLTTKRKEMDQPRFVSGLFQGHTCGAPLCGVIENTDTHSEDYQKLADIPRPSHADWPAWVKHRGYNDYRGGGHFSARLTAPFCMAGGILLQILAKRGISIRSRLLAVGPIQDQPWSPLSQDWPSPQPNTWGLPVSSPDIAADMANYIQAIAQSSDSVGGVVECCVTGMPVGVGEPFFDSLESQISHVVFSIPAVKGIEFGSGFISATRKGSENNDPYCILNGTIQPSTNHHGGILGGLSTGVPVVFRVAFKPTPSIAQPQASVSIRHNSPESLTIQGRHDPCVAIRAVPCIEAAAAIALAEDILG